MGSAFAIVVVGVVVAATIVAVIVSLTSGGLYERIGRGGLSLDRDEHRPPAVGSAAAKAEADEEIRQLVEAKSARRVMRGEAPLDVDAEIAALTSTGGVSPMDASLREEVRQLVVARNARRVARGQEPVDVEAEVDRQLRDLGA